MVLRDCEGLLLVTLEYTGQLRQMIRSCLCSVVLEDQHGSAGCWGTGLWQQGSNLGPCSCVPPCFEPSLQLLFLKPCPLALFPASPGFKPCICAEVLNMFMFLSAFTHSVYSSLFSAAIFYTPQVVLSCDSRPKKSQVDFLTENYFMSAAIPISVLKVNTIDKYKYFSLTFMDVFSLNYCIISPVVIK